MANDDKSRKVADHFYLDTAGGLGEENKGVDIETAAGYRYVDVASGETFERALPTGDGLRMLAAFGLKTKAGHVASGNRNNPSDPAISDVAAISDWFDNYLLKGAWMTEREGGGVRYDLDRLAAAVVKALGKSAKGDAAHYRARLEDTTPLGDGRTYYQAVLSRDDVKANYRALKAQDDLRKARDKGESADAIA